MEEAVFVRKIIIECKLNTMSRTKYFISGQSVQAYTCKIHVMTAYP